jgi:hypothetical protein
MGNRGLIGLLLLLTLLMTSSVGPALAQGSASAPIIFSLEAQVARQPLALTMSSTVGGTIRYTTNGSVPGPDSAPYQGPIVINGPTVIRAQVFDNAGQPVGWAQTKSYIIAGYEQTIPVMSIATEWGFLDALHANPRERGAEWERPVNVEYFEPGGRLGFNVPAGIRIHGNFSRLFNIKKSYRLYFRNDYGLDRLNYRLFEDTPVTTFDKLVLRAGFQDTFTHRNIPDRANREQTAKYISDQVVRNLHRDMGQPIAHGRWVLLYLNGQFWGLYNLTERIDLQMLRSYSHEAMERLANPNLPPPPEGVEIGGEWDVIVKESGWDDQGRWYSAEEVKDGGYGGWLENQNWVGSANFTIPENIGELEWRVDIENIFSYMFLQAYVQHTDWPGANWVVYRRYDIGAQGSERQWRMMVWDAEDTFGNGEGGRKDMNTVERVHSPHDSITRILEKPFIGYCGFKHRFVDRAREYLGVENKYGKPEDQIGQLSKERVKAEILKQAEIARPFMQMEINRWAPDLSVAHWEANIQDALKFVDAREEVILHHLDILRYQTFTQCK